MLQTLLFSLGVTYNNGRDNWSAILDDITVWQKGSFISNMTWFFKEVN